MTIYTHIVSLLYFKLHNIHPMPQRNILRHSLLKHQSETSCQITTSIESSPSNGLPPHSGREMFLGVGLRYTAGGFISPKGSSQLRRLAFSSGSAAKCKPIPGSITVLLSNQSHGGKSRSEPGRRRLQVVATTLESSARLTSGLQRTTITKPTKQRRNGNYERPAQPVKMSHLSIQVSEIDSSPPSMADVEDYDQFFINIPKK